MDAQKPTIFLSYATPDRARVLPYFEYLEGRGYSVWMDFRSIKGGQKWDLEIRRALDRATIIVVFISENSVDRRSYLQREIVIALDKAQEKLISDIYVIPILLDDNIKVPDQIKSLQCIKASDSDCQSAIDDAIRHQLDILGAESQAVQRSSKINWTQSIHKESWDGLPGYEIEYALMNFSSKEYPQIADITSCLKADLINLAMEQRFAKFSQDTERFSFGDERYSRTNTMEAYCSEPAIVSKIISIQYAIHAYGAGAAHPNMWFHTRSFILDPVVSIRSLKDIFEDPESALVLISQQVRKQLLTPVDGDDNSCALDVDWVERGTKDWNDFSAFVFKEEGIDFFFSPYMVSCYADGVQFASVDYEQIVKKMKPEYVSALGIKYKFWNILNDDHSELRTVT